MDKTKIIAIVVGVILLGIVIYFLVPKEADSINIMDRFDDKIVYTTDISLDDKPFRDHCKLEGGLFNSCGSPCPTHEQFCAQVCAYTCDDL